MRITDKLWQLALSPQGAPRPAIAPNRRRPQQGSIALHHVG